MDTWSRVLRFAAISMPLYVSSLKGNTFRGKRGGAYVESVLREADDEVDGEVSAGQRRQVGLLRPRGAHQREHHLWGKTSQVNTRAFVCVQPRHIVGDPSKTFISSLAGNVSSSS